MQDRPFLISRARRRVLVDVDRAPIGLMRRARSIRLARVVREPLLQEVARPPGDRHRGLAAERPCRWNLTRTHRAHIGSVVSEVVPHRPLGESHDGRVGAPRRDGNGIVSSASDLRDLLSQGPEFFSSIFTLHRQVGLALFAIHPGKSAPPLPKRSTGCDDDCSNHSDDDSFNHTASLLDSDATEPQPGRRGSHGPMTTRNARAARPLCSARR